MDILVIGGTKFFGIPMIWDLLDKGHHITIATRGNVLDPFGNSVSRIKMDRQKPDEVKRLLGKRHYDVVIDKVAYCSNDVKALRDSFKCDRYIQMSSMSVYSNEHMMITEEEFNAEDYDLNWCNREDYDYGEVKRQAECAVCQVYHESAYTLVRYPVVLGKSDYTKRLEFYVEHIINEKPMYIDNLHYRMCFIQEEEAGKFISWLVEHPVHGAVNGCSKGEVSIKDIISYIERKTGKQAILSKDGDYAPYNGCNNDFTMDTGKAEKKGFHFTDINSWIYELIDWNIKQLENKLTFRYAERKDVSLILHFIKELADYEKLSDEVVATEDLLEEWIFDKKKAEVIFAVVEDKTIGFALFFHNFSTFLGRSGIYLEDLFILPESRGRGYGKAVLKKLAQIALERGCGRLEWWCLDWNKPSVDFYLSLGAEPMKDWTVYRVAGNKLNELAT